MVFTAKSLMMLVYSGGSYAVTPRKRSVPDKTKNLIRDVKRRSFWMSRNPQVIEKGRQRETQVERERDFIIHDQEPQPWLPEEVIQDVKKPTGK